MPSQLPRALRPLNRRTVLMATISFSLTIAGGSIALLLGLIPPTITVLRSQIDVAVLLLMVPLCALTLAILLEVLSAALRGLPHVRGPIDTPALSGWRPGQGEG